MDYTSEDVKDMDQQEALNAWMDQHTQWRVEGRRGIETLCKLARGLGYQDPMYFGQIGYNMYIGDLIEMLQDNSGMIEAMVNWVGERRNQEWEEAFKSSIEVTDPELPKEEDYETFDEWQEAVDEFNEDQRSRTRESV